MNDKDLACGCPGANSKIIEREDDFCENTDNAFVAKQNSDAAKAKISQLKQWPVQIKLVLEDAPYFHNANLLIAADCASYAYAGFHQDFMKDNTTIIGCPKLDDEDYANKLTNIFKKNDIQSITVVRMEVPCCYGIYEYVEKSLANCGKDIPLRSVVLTTDGKILEDKKSLKVINLDKINGRTFIMKNENAKIISFDFKTGTGLPNHTHDGMACVQIISGSADLSFVDGRKMSLSTGDIMEFDARDEHNLIATQDAKIIVTIIMK